MLRATHTQLELVASKGKRAGTVAVGVVAQDVGNLVDAKVHHLALMRSKGVVVHDSVDNTLDLVAQEDGDNRRRCLVCAKAVIVASRGNRGTKQACVLVDACNQAGKNNEELQVVLGLARGLEQVFVVGRDRPVVVLAGAVNVLKGLLGLEAGKAVLGSKQA